MMRRVFRPTKFAAVIGRSCSSGKNSEPAAPKEEVVAPTVAPTVADVVSAAKDRDFPALKGHAETLFSAHWKEEFALPAACLAILLVVYYWQSSSRRRTERICAKLEADAKDELKGLREQVNSLKNKWTKDMKTREEQTRSVQKANSELATNIDQMAVALKQCAPRSFESSSV